MTSETKSTEATPSAPPALSAKPPTPPPSSSQSDPEPNQKISTSAETTDAPTTPPFSPSSTTPVLGKEGQEAEAEKEPELDFVGNVEVNNDIPSEDDLKKVEDMLVLDAQGRGRPFKDLYKGEGVAPRQLVIFVRHFFCGVSPPLSSVEKRDGDLVRLWARV